VQSARRKVQGARCNVQGARCKVQGAKFKVLLREMRRKSVFHCGSKFKVPVSMHHAPCYQLNVQFTIGLDIILKIDHYLSLITVLFYFYVLI